MTQLTLFNHEDAEQPVPLEVAAMYNFPLQRHTLDNDTLVYSVQDWIMGVAQTDNPKRFWSDLKKRAQKSQADIYASCVPLPYKASDGKSYKMDFADETTLYRITQHMGVDTGIRNEVLSFLAKSGAFVSLARTDMEGAQIQMDAQRRANTVKVAPPSRQMSPRETPQKALGKPDKDTAWIVARELGTITRKQFVAMLVHVNPTVDIGRATNDVYRGVTGMTAKGLRTVLNLGEKANPRDHMSALALGYTMIAEESCRIRLAEYADDDILPIDAVHEVLTVISQGVGIQADQWAKTLGVNLVTGQRLLS